MSNLTPTLWYRTELDNPRDAGPVVDVNKLAECLPHGSGIDGNWHIEVKRNGDVTCHGEYHAMDDNGFYCGWRNFRFSIRRHRGANKIQPLSGPCAGSFQVLKVKGRIYFDTFVGGGDASDYLFDTCYFAVVDALDVHSMEQGMTMDSEQAALAVR